MPLRGLGNLAARRTRAALEESQAGRYRMSEWIYLLIEYYRTPITVIVGYAYEGLSLRVQPKTGVLRHPQDVLVIVYALASIAQAYKSIQKEDCADYCIQCMDVFRVALLPSLGIPIHTGHI
ncbi:hypothetical protein EA473_13555 [Natrarchaeobius chitinivorans]|uniref:Uncharacterized protein n=1 Tax=Natrarchaeobius chitinivorans TaxID=1679083 RepID=A0A3N6LYD4_NATCH|nr:hypothetical protein EA473_13555 [Natrarchaeobius chitinivorans]